MSEESFLFTYSNSEDNELLLEFTDRNCKEEEIELLKMIYEESLDQSIKLKPFEDGYNLCGQDGELLLEIAEEDYSKKELDLLKYIYEVALEYRENI